MRLKSVIRLMAVTSLLVGGTFSQASAGVITGATVFKLPGASTGTLGPLGSTPAPNNDDAPFVNPNVVNSSVFLNAGGLGIMDIEFTTANSNGTTEYQFVQTFLNNTGSSWKAFHMELGYGTGDNFVRSGSIDFLDFDTPDMTSPATSTPFGVVNQQDDTLDFSGATVGAFGTTAFRFRIDVPDALKDNKFTLREYALTEAPAAVPEPTSMLLLGSGLVGLAARLRTRRDA